MIPHHKHDQQEQNPSSAQTPFNPLPLLRSIYNILPRNRTRLHLIINHLQLRQADDLVRRLDEPAAEEVDRLGRVLAVADVAALDGDHLNDGLEDGRFQVRAGGHANADDGSARADVLGRC
jgi:hypothetical protein